MSQKGTAIVLCDAADGRPLGANDEALALLGLGLAELLDLTAEGLDTLVAPLSVRSQPWRGRSRGRLLVLEPRSHVIDLTEAGSDVPGSDVLVRHLRGALERIEPSRGTVAVLFVDIEDEHEWALQLVPGVADRLRSAVRRTDLVTRVGPTGFAVVCERVQGEIEAAGLAAEVVDDLSLPVAIGNAEVVPRVSIGVALAGDPGMAPVELDADPDAATAEARTRGRARHAAFAHAARHRSDRQEILTRAVAEALAADELDVHYQPLVDLRDGAVLGVEALARWFPATAAPVSPERFIPVAERSGLIHALGEWVLLRACRFAAGRNGLDLAVNVSPRQVRDDLVGRVIRALEETGLAAGRLHLEVTESAFIEDPDTATTVLRRLTNLGVRLSLDDFGTGYSSLLVLRRLPFDRLKIDRSFVRSVTETPADRDVVAAVLGLARAVGVHATAEGVETEEQARVLRDLGCDEAQGFLFGRPMPAAAFDP